MPEPRAEPLRAKITVLGTHVITSADPVGRGESLAERGGHAGSSHDKQN